MTVLQRNGKPKVKDMDWALPCASPLFNSTAILWKAYSPHFTKGKTDLQKYRITQPVKGRTSQHLLWPTLLFSLTPGIPVPITICLCQPHKKVQRFKISTNQKQKSKERLSSTLSPFSSQCKLHNWLAIQIMWSTEEHLSTLEGPCACLGN